MHLKPNGQPSNKPSEWSSPVIVQHACITKCRKLGQLPGGPPYCEDGFTSLPMVEGWHGATGSPGATNSVQFEREFVSGKT